MTPACWTCSGDWSRNNVNLFSRSRGFWGRGGDFQNPKKRGLLDRLKPPDGLQKFPLLRGKFRVPTGRRFREAVLQRADTDTHQLPDSLAQGCDAVPTLIGRHLFQEFRFQRDRDTRFFCGHAPHPHAVVYHNRRVSRKGEVWHNV